MSINLNRSVSKRPSISNTLIQSQDNVIVGSPNQESLNQNLRTRRTRCVVNFSLEDFTRIHAQFSDKNRAAHVETPVYSFYDNENIKFQLRFVPGKHSLNFDVLYKGSDPSAQLFLELYLLDQYGRRHNFDYGRKVECQLSAHNSESIGNYIYDRDDLEKKRDKLFVGDKLVVSLEVSATWIEVSDNNSNTPEK
ncbi:unnamed protein product [Brachionus calyciflorus]|uniref:Uncharacterized protein n=1 Tax=Brachionus calyciflorus TaxID=104777 RepID=A0A813SHG8_9BILA|nr:unnamed protein product [Brachionus calyciflorus]